MMSLFLWRILRRVARTGVVKLILAKLEVAIAELMTSVAQSIIAIVKQ